MLSREAKAERIFLDAVERCAPDQWPALVQEACGGEPEVRDRVAALLEAHQHPHPLLEIEGVSAPLDRPPITEAPGMRVGRYKLLEQIGAGGFGVVFMAEQIEPVRRKVALKIIKPGMDTKEVIARFAAERQALALMDHPNVARVLDGGTTESGRPYFVMELVCGVSITDYCDKRRLPTRQRLQLFQDVCQAVQHAHHKGIIHRDIKPSNIMVTLADGEPVVKVIDFGVAKAISQPLTEKTLFTRYGQMVGTPQYMSPEQAEMSGLDIDTRSDIYSLGVLLYELLIGSTPLTTERLRTIAYAEMQRLIREEPSPRPSTRLSTASKKQRVEIADGRRASPHELHRQLQGDLDWIVMKSLEKDRRRRYGTATEFAADIERYLAGDVVSACPPSVAYRLRKFARRHRVVLATGGIVAAVLLVASIVSIGFGLSASRAERVARQQQRRAERERDAADRLRQNERQLRTVADAQAKSMHQQLHGLLIGRAMQAHEANNVPGMRAALDQCPADLRGWEWSRLNWLARPKQLLTIAANEVPVFIDHDRKLVAVSADRSAVAVWDATTGQLVEQLDLSDTFAPADHPILMEAVGPNQRYVVVSDGQGRLALGDLQTGKRHWVINGHAGRVDGLAFSPDGTRIASVSWDGTVKLWQTQSGKLAWSGGPVHQRLRGVVFSPTGRQIVTTVNHWSEGSQGPARVWDARTGKVLHRLQHGRVAECATYTADGHQIITGGVDGTLRLWDAETGREVRRLPASRSIVESVAISPDGKTIACGCVDHTVNVLDTATGKILQTFRGHDDWAYWLAFSADGQRLASSALNQICIWSVTTSSDTLRLSVDEGHLVNLVFSPDGDRVAAGGAGRAIHLWQVSNGRQLRTLHGHGAAILGLAWRPGCEELASCDTNGFVRIWDTATGVVKHAFRPRHGWGLSGNELAYRPDGGQLAWTGPDGVVMVFDADTGSTVATLNAGPSQQMSLAAFSPDGKWLAAASADGKITIWDAETFEPVSQLTGHEGWVTDFEFSPDSRWIVSSGEDRTIRLWDWASGTQLRTIGAHSMGVWSVVFMPDGRRVISGDGNGWIKVFDVQKGRELLAWQDGVGWIMRMAVSPDGSTLASIPYGSAVNLWETRPPTEAPGWPCHRVSAIRRVVDRRFERLTYARDVIAALQSDDELPPHEAELAIQLALARGDNPYRLSCDAWDVAWPKEGDRPRLQEALRRAEMACKIADCSEYQCTRALALYRLERHQEALDAFRLAGDLRRRFGLEDHPNILAGTAMVLGRLGRTDQAARTLAAAPPLLSTMRKRDDVELRLRKWYGDSQAEALLAEARSTVLSK